MLIETRFAIELRAFGDDGIPGATGVIAVDPRCPEAALEQIFGWYNHGSPYERSFEHRSLSVGDVVHLGETTWRCAVVGWEVER